MIIVTGANGYIGKELMNVLPTAVGMDIDDWDITVPRDPDPNVSVVVHLAGLVRVGEGEFKTRQYWDANFNGTKNVIHAFPNAKMIFASTGAAFNPESVYAQTKVAAEELIKVACEQYTIFRFFNVGGGSPTNPEGLPAAIERAKRDGHFTINGSDYKTKDGTCVRDFIHVEDLVLAIKKAVNSPAAMTEYEPLGSGKSYTVKEYVETYIKKYEADFKVEYGPRRRGDLESSEVPFLSEFITPTKTLWDIV